MDSSYFRTINLMNTLVKSGDDVEKFENIIEECKNNKTKYVDQDFYPQKSIIEQDKNILEEHEWRRIENQYPNLFDNISPDGVQQGKLGDCYFVASLVFAAHNKEYVKYLFHPKSSLEYGCALIYFHFLGERVSVIIDTQIPYRGPDSIEPLFSRPRTNEDSCWFVLVEKAFAKACGGYYFIESGQTHFGMRVLLDQFPVAMSKIEEIVPESILSKPKIDLKGEIFKALLNLKKKNAMIGSDIKIENFPNITKDELQKSTGLISEHAYQILDVREAQKKRFLKVRNPWGQFEWTGAYSDDSKLWTESLKKELGHESKDDGTFWMILDDFLTYFKSLDYSLPEEKTWKKYNVYGKIEGYLDGRSPCTNCKSVGCLPQWTIKFTKKTVVRLSYDVAGPPSFHGIYICKAHGQKIDSLGTEIEIARNTTNTVVNGIEYEVNDFSEPFTFFLCRTDPSKETCYYRILIESPDKNFTVKKFDDNFLAEKWNSVSHQGMFASPKNDFWDPFGKKSLTTCTQWALHFPELKKNQQTELRIQLYKNVSEGPLYLFLARTDEKISYAYTSLKYIKMEAYAVSDYEEYRVIVDNKPKEGDESGKNEQNQWTFCVFRNEQNDVSHFKFVIHCKSKIELNMMPEPDPLKNCGYSVTGKLQPGKKDGLSPYNDGVKDLKQWCLQFKKSPTILFVDYSQKNAKSDHCVYLEIRDNPGQKMDQFFKGTTHFDLDVSSGTSFDRAMWNIQDASKPYALCVSREQASSTSEYTINIFGDNNFEMHEIVDGKLGQSVPKYKAKKDDKKLPKALKFNEIKSIEQPNNFTPKKTQKQSKKTANQPQKSNKNDQKTKKEQAKPTKGDKQQTKADQKPTKEETKPTKGDKQQTKVDQKPMKEEKKPTKEDAKTDQKPVKDETKPTKGDKQQTKTDQKPTKEETKSTKGDKQQTKIDQKPNKEEQKPTKEETKADQKPTKEETKPAKEDKQQTKTDQKPTKGDKQQTKTDQKPVKEGQKSDKNDEKSTKSNQSPAKPNKTPTNENQKPSKTEIKIPMHEHSVSTKPTKTADQTNANENDHNQSKCCLLI